MTVFIENITSFPVIVFTFLMVIILFYWVFALIGVIDIEIFDFDIEVDADLDAEGMSGFAGFMTNWGLTGLPVTAVLSLLISTSWLLCYVVVSLVYPLIPFESIKWLIGILLIILCIAISIPITAKIIRPFRNIFVSHSAVKKNALIGSTCIVKTQKVNEKYGQAELNDGGAGMLLDVRAKEDDNIVKGDEVILVEYDEENEVYYIGKTQ